MGTTGLRCNSSHRRAFLAYALGSAFAFPRPAVPQPTPVARSYRVGYFELKHPGSFPPKGAWGAKLESELEQLGFSERTNTAFDYMLVEWEGRGRLAEKARELVAMRPDAIFSEYPTDVAEATSTIPIVFANIGELRAISLVGDLKRPRANVTGVLGPYWDHLVKRLEATRELLPKARRLALVYNSDVSWVDARQRELAETDRVKRLGFVSELAVRLGFEVIVGDVGKHAASLDAALESVRKQGAEIIFPIASASIRDKDRYSKFQQFQVAHRIAYIGDGGFGREAPGPVLSWGMDWNDHYRRAAEMIAQILKGRRTADIPVDVTSRFLITVDKRAATALNLEVPGSILLRADRIVQ